MRVETLKRAWWRELSILMPERKKEIKEIKNIGYCLLDDLAPVDLQHVV